MPKRRRRRRKKKKKKKKKRRRRRRWWRRMKSRHWEMLSAEGLKVLINTVCCGTYIIVGPRVSLEEILIFTASLVHIVIHQKDR